MSKIETPALDAQTAAIAPEKVNDTLTAFYDWLSAEGIVLARYGRKSEVSRTCTNCRGRGIDSKGMTPRERQLMIAGLLPDDDWPKCETCNGDKVEWVTRVDEDSLAPIHDTPDALFARFLKLDPDEMDRERQALLAVLRDEAPAGYAMDPDGTWRKSAALA